MPSTLDTAKIIQTLQVDQDGVPVPGGVVELSPADSEAIQDTATNTGAIAGVVATETSLSAAVTQLNTQTTHLATIAAEASSTDPAAVVFDTAKMVNGTTSLTVKFVPISGTGSADLVALVTGKKIRVLSYTIVLNADSTVKFQSGGSTDLTGAMPHGAKGGVSVAFSPVGHFETASGEKLNLVLGTSVAWGGHLAYVEV